MERSMAMDPKVEEVVKKCTTERAIQGLSADEVELLNGYYVDHKKRLKSENDFLGKKENVKFFTFTDCRQSWCWNLVRACEKNSVN